MYFFLFLSLNTTKNPGHCVENKYKILKGEDEKEADWLGTSGPDELLSGVSPVFQFCLIYLTLDTEGAGNLKIPVSAEKRKQNKNQ